jgi:hypothetical protein
MWNDIPPGPQRKVMFGLIMLFFNFGFSAALLIMVCHPGAESVHCSVATSLCILVLSCMLINEGYTEMFGDDDDE